MRLEFRFLRSKVARRIFLLFVACSLLPILVLSFISLRFVTDELETQEQRRLHQTARSMGMEILGRLALAESEMRLLATAIGARDEPTLAGPLRGLVEELATRFDGVAVVHQARPTEVSLGSVAAPEAVRDAGRDHRADGAVHLHTASDPGGVTRLWLSMAIDGGSPDSSILVGELTDGYLWGVSDGVTLPTAIELLVLDANGVVFFDSRQAGTRLPQEALDRLDRSSSGDLEWRQDRGDVRGRFWTMFLGARYGAPDWTVLVSMSRADAVAPLERFKRLLPLVSLLCMAVVVWLSVVQIRRSLVPLVSLQQGTHRIARREFDTRVRVASGDEFEQLAESFNAMAAELGRQFKTLTARSEIDRAILSTVKEAEIVRTVLARIPDHFICARVTVTVIDGHRDHATRTYSRPDAADDAVEVSETRLTPEERSFLSDADERLMLLTRDELPACALPGDTDSGHFLVLPVSSRGSLSGCITLGYDSAPEFRPEDLVDARRLANQVAVALSNARLFHELEQVNWETLHALARAVDANSPWTAGHSERVTTMAVELGRRLGLPERELTVIQRGGLLHDVGKIGVPTPILDKPGRLTPEEMERMRAHVVIGARILEPISSYSEEIPLVLYHHEHFDGTGYPEGIAGEAIPFNARVLSVADVFDALGSRRPYRPGWETRRVVEYIRDGAGTLFDPMIVAVFLEMMNEPDRPRGERESERCSAS